MWNRIKQHKLQMPLAAVAVYVSAQVCLRLGYNLPFTLLIIVFLPVYFIAVGFPLRETFSNFKDRLTGHKAFKNHIEAEQYVNDHFREWREEFPDIYYDSVFQKSVVFGIGVAALYMATVRSIQLQSHLMALLQLSPILIVAFYTAVRRTGSKSLMTSFIRLIGPLSIFGLCGQILIYFYHGRPEYLVPGNHYLIIVVAGNLSISYRKWEGPLVCAVMSIFLFLFFKKLDPIALGISPMPFFLMWMFSTMMNLRTYSLLANTFYETHQREHLTTIQNASSQIAIRLGIRNNRIGVDRIYTEKTSEIFGPLNEQDFESYFLSRFKLSSSQHREILDAIQLCIGSSLFTFESNRRYLPNDLNLSVDTETRIFELRWRAISETNNPEYLQSILLVGDDVTELRKAISERQAEERKNRLIIELSVATKHHAPQFVQKTKTFLDDILLTRRADIDRTVSNLLADLHTIKGDALTHGLDTLANALHDAEDSLEALRNGDHPKNIDYSNAFKSSKNILEDYAHIMAHTLDWVDTGEKIVLDRDLAKTLFFMKNSALRLKADSPELEESRLKEVYSKIFPDLHKSLRERLKSVFANGSFPDHDEPVILWIGINPILSPQAQPELQKVLLHILTNSLSHGIEKKDERLAAGKTISGNITVRCTASEPNLNLEWSDDGRGLSLEALRALAQKRGIDTKGWSIARLVDLIFEAGFSTKTSVNIHAGRGQGLHAVRLALHKVDGSIAAHLDERNRLTFSITMPLKHMEGYIDASNGLKSAI